MGWNALNKILCFLMLLSTGLGILAVLFLSSFILALSGSSGSGILAGSMFTLLILAFFVPSFVAAIFMLRKKKWAFYLSSVIAGLGVVVVAVSFTLESIFSSLLMLAFNVLVIANSVHWIGALGSGVSAPVTSQAPAQSLVA